MSIASASVPSSKGERRSQRRYRTDLTLRWKTVRGNQFGFGKLHDMSSGGICFLSSDVIAPGMVVELSIDWPTLLGGQCRLQLKVDGRVVRSDKCRIAISIMRYDFRTRKASAGLTNLAEKT